MNLKPASLLLGRTPARSRVEGTGFWREDGREEGNCVHFPFVEGRKGEEARACFTLDAQAAWLGRMVPGAQLAFLPQKGGQDEGRQEAHGEAGREKHILGHQLHKGSEVHTHGHLCPHDNLPSKQVRRLRAGGVD